MIQANELRIGNFIKVISSTKTFDSFITQAKGYDIVRIEEKTFNIWNYELVILDEEWLIKLGLKKIEEYCFELDDIHVNTKRELIWITTKCKRELEFNIPNYIHELQNLYFALTNKELSL